MILPADLWTRAQLATPADFGGAWEERYELNVPGPLYSTTANLMSTLAAGGSDFIAWDQEPAHG